ncbi:sensor histidine kinase [Leucobacter luti]|nr:ATP-binding protein [Leucobacter luti]
MQNRESFSYSYLARRTKFLLFLFFLTGWLHGVVHALVWIETLVSPWWWIVAAVAVLLMYLITVQYLDRAAHRSPVRDKRVFFCSMLAASCVITILTDYGFVFLIAPAVLLLLLETPRWIALTLGTLMLSLATALYWPYYDWKPQSFVPLVYGIGLIVTIFVADAAIMSIRVSRDRLTRALQDLTLSRKQFEEIGARPSIALERNRLSSEIHDSFTQNSLALSMLLARLGLEANDGVRQEILNECENLAERNLLEARRLVRSLGSEETVALRVLSLNEDIEALRIEYSHRSELLGTPMQWVFQQMSPVQATDGATANLLLRAAHIFLANALHHSHADIVRIALSGAGGGLLLSVCDDGTGVDESLRATERIESTGLGLTLLHDRLTADGGSLDMTSEPGQGTCVSAWLPSNSEGISHGSKPD